MDSARLGILIAMIVFPAAGTVAEDGRGLCFCLASEPFLFMKILEKIKFKDTIFIPLSRIDAREYYQFYRDLFRVQARFDPEHEHLVSRRLFDDYRRAIRIDLCKCSFVLLAYLFANKFTVAGMGEDFQKI